MQNRRNFLKQASSGICLSALYSLPNEVLAANDRIKITILHTNDMHSRIDPFPSDDSKNGGAGGMAARAWLVSKIRSEEQNVLLLDAGDIFQGTPYFNYFGGEPEFKLMSKMGYDAATLGNHDFDNGLEGILKPLPHAVFPFICSNYDFSDTPLYGKTIPHKIFEKSGIRIGVFGLGIDLKGLVPDHLTGNTRYENPVDAAKKEVKYLREEKNCQVVICLSHLGFKYKELKMSDENLAGLTSGIDLIIGGHTHTFLDQPVEFKNQDGKPVLVAQAGWGGIKLGRIDFYFRKSGGIFSSSGDFKNVGYSASLQKVLTKPIGPM